MYQCSICHTTMAYPLDVCPHCHARLSGVRCQSCGHTDTKSAFISNNHNCPKCGRAVHIPGVAGPGSIKINKNLAAFFQRFAAYLIDFLLIFPIFLASLFVSKASGGANATVLFAGIVVVWLYFVVMESSSLQATVGKLALGMKVTDENGGRISFGRATARFWGKLLSTLILYGGFLMIALNDKQQGLHDNLSGCRVVRR